MPVVVLSRYGFKDLFWLIWSGKKYYIAKLVKSFTTFTLIAFANILVGIISALSIKAWGLRRTWRMGRILLIGKKQINQ